MVAWGGNATGQTDVPQDLNNVIAISAGNQHSLALKGDGTVVAWGRNDKDQATVPEGLSDVVAVAAGYQHSVALKQDGSVWATGWNHYGQLGDGSTNTSRSFVSVATISEGASCTVPRTCTCSLYLHRHSH